MDIDMILLFSRLILKFYYVLFDLYVYLKEKVCSKKV